MIYNGQEAGNPRRLKFLERDPLNGAITPMVSCIGTFSLEEQHTALWNAPWGARMIPVVNSAPSSVLSFVRPTTPRWCSLVLNLSKTRQLINSLNGLHYGRMSGTP